MTSAIILACAVLIDLLMGDPRRWHPLAGFGQLATRVDYALHPGFSREAPSLLLRLAGLAGWALLVVPFSLAAWYLSRIRVMGPVFDVVFLYFAIGAKSLAQHAQAVSGALEDTGLEEARRRVGMMVSRDTGDLNKTDIIRATCESVLENGNDAVFAAVFWFLVLGAPGAVLYRLANTLDAMWGYRTPRYRYFGWAAARMDDVLNWIPARLTALTYAVLGKTRHALRCWATQSRHWYSPNAGPVMATGAGALDMELGGSARYQGALKTRPILGCGHPPEIADIARAVRLVQRGLVLWVALALAGGWLHA
ncbi:MAG: adenosylcobinamide-phosphate synthase CbiB [Acidiferrobacterales bacterium]